MNAPGYAEIIIRPLSFDYILQKANPERAF